MGKSKKRQAKAKVTAQSKALKDGDVTKVTGGNIAVGDYQAAVNTIADVQKKIYGDALSILKNLKA